MISDRGPFPRIGTPGIEFMRLCGNNRGSKVLELADVPMWWIRNLRGGTTQPEQGQTNICDCDNFSSSKIFSASLADIRFCSRSK